MKKILLLLFTTILLVGCIENSTVSFCPCIVTSVTQTGDTYDIQVRAKGKHLNTINDTWFKLRSEAKVNVGDTLKFVPVK